jgi:hypothetical protein
MPNSLKLQIVIHVCYRGIFRSPILKRNLLQFLKVEEDNQAFKEAILELKSEGLIEEKNGYLVTVGNVDWIDIQTDKNFLTNKLIAKGENFLRFFSKIPFVMFIGISGSLAANNPVVDKNGLNIGKVDMDLFVISSANTMWILFLFERLITNLYKLIFRESFYCFNYVTDRTFLQIHNKNFYTATELYNMKLIYDNNVYDDFIRTNSWYEKYYPEIEYVANNEGKKNVSSTLKFLSPLNYVCYILFCCGRAIKRFEIAPIKEISNRFNPVNKCNLKRIANSNGGYQELIKLRFKENFLEKFRAYYSDHLLNELFPPNESFSFSIEKSTDADMDILFEKYAS